MTYQERAALFAYLAPPLQAELWRLHLGTFIREHPELTPEQQGVIQKALSFFQDYDWVQIRETSPKWAEKKQQMRELEEAARLHLSATLAREAFGRLGPPFVPIPSESMPPDSKPCECSSESDWCGSGRQCIPDPWLEVCYPVLGCGTFLQYACDGICV